MASPSSPTRTYADAITALNTLQTNFKALDAIRKSGQRMNDAAIPEMREWCTRAGFKPSDLSAINFLHISGTKGKGSTSAFTSHLLTSYPTIGPVGLYTSPHLRSVRERIRINNTPISQELFTKYFFEMWDTLEESARKEGRDPKDKPMYFRYLTALAFHIFLREGIKTVVLEVGIGGEYDSTNIIETPSVVGISKLGIDHTAILGNTIEEISWNKAGIMKSGCGCLAFSVEQEEAAKRVLENRAKEKDVPLRFVDASVVGDAELGLSGAFQKENAALAVEMVRAHLKKVGIEVPETGLSEEFRKGLQQTMWPGRCQILERDGRQTYYLDGAHTKDSVQVAARWFTECLESKIPKDAPITLIFNQQERDAVLLLRTLMEIVPKERRLKAVFCTNTTYKEGGYSPELTSLTSDSDAVKLLTVQNALKEVWDQEKMGDEAKAVATIEEAVEIAEGNGGVVFTCGSLHLVGGVLEVLQAEV